VERGILRHPGIALSGCVRNRRRITLGKVAMDNNIRPYLDAFLIAVFPLLQVYLVLLLKSQIDKFHQTNKVVSDKVDQVISTQADVATTLAQQTSDIETAHHLSQTTVPAVPVIPPAKGT
jgi:hypothetical protein